MVRWYLSVRNDARRALVAYTNLRQDNYLATLAAARINVPLHLLGQFAFSMYKSPDIDLGENQVLLVFILCSIMKTSFQDNRSLTVNVDPVEHDILRTMEALMASATDAGKRLLVLVSFQGLPALTGYVLAPTGTAGKPISGVVLMLISKDLERAKTAEFLPMVCFVSVFFILFIFLLRKKYDFADQVRRRRAIQVRRYKSTQRRQAHKRNGKEDKAARSGRSGQSGRVEQRQANADRLW